MIYPVLPTIMILFYDCLQNPLRIDQNRAFNAYPDRIVHVSRPLMLSCSSHIQLTWCLLLVRRPMLLIPREESTRYKEMQESTAELSAIHTRGFAIIASVSKRQDKTVQDPIRMTTFASISQTRRQLFCTRTKYVKVYIMQHGAAFFPRMHETNQALNPATGLYLCSVLLSVDLQLSASHCQRNQGSQKRAYQRDHWTYQL